jgi:hypothetical protein
MGGPVGNNRLRKMPINRADRDDIVSDKHGKSPAVGHQQANILTPVGNDEVATYLAGTLSVHPNVLKSLTASSFLRKG